MKYFSIAIDGPGGAGKSTIARLIAAKLGYIYIDTGAMYRAVALYCLNSGIDLKNEDAVCAGLAKINIEIKYIEGEQHIFLNAEDISQQIRTPEVSQGSSVVAVYQKVREKLVMLQQKIAENDNIIMDGRDIGSDVLPFADVKVYLDASVDIRVQRRLDERKISGISMNREELEREIKERDLRDMNREFSPLKKAADAILVDSSDMTRLEVRDYILNLIEAAQAKAKES